MILTDNSERKNFNFVGRKANLDATTSLGLPNKNFGTILYPLLQLILVFLLTRLVSTATSQAEFPPPITSML